MTCNRYREGGGALDPPALDAAEGVGERAKRSAKVAAVPEGGSSDSERFEVEEVEEEGKV